MQLPIDFTPEEREIYQILLRRIYEPINTRRIYDQLKSPEDMFLVAFVFELGNPRTLAAEILGVDRRTIYNRIQKLKEVVANWASSQNLIKQ